MGVTQTDCFKSIRDRYGSDVISDDDIKVIVEDIFEHRKSMQEAGEVLAKRDWDKIYKDKMEVRIEDAKFKRAINLEKQREVKDFLDGFRKDRKKAGLRELLDITNQKQKIAKHKYDRMFLHGLKHNKLGNLWDIVNSGRFDKEIFIASQNMDLNGRIPSDLKLPAEAVEIAKVMRTVYDEMYIDKRTAGILTGHVDNYMGPQSHSPDKIIDSTKEDFGFAAWSTSILKELDLVKTFKQDAGNRSLILASLQASFDRIRHGTNEVAIVARGAEDRLIDVVNHTSPVNAITRSRKFVFKDAEAAWSYNKQFGRRSISENMLISMDTNARTIGLADTFGTNPEASFIKTAREHGVIGADGKPDSFTNAMFRNITGEAHRGGTSMVAAVGKTVRTLQNIFKLPLSGVSALSDIATFSGMIQKYGGEGFMDSMTKAPIETILRMNKPNQIKYSKMMGFFYDDMIDSSHARFGIDGERLGGNNKFVDLALKMEAGLFKYNGLNAVTARTKLAGMKLLSNFYGAEAHLDFKSLPDALRNKLELHRITSDDWNLIRKGAVDDGGRLIIDPSSIDGATVASRRASDRYRMMLFDTVEKEVSPTPGLRESAIQNRGFSQDDVYGQLWRVGTQYMSFPLAMITTMTRGAGFSSKLGIMENVKNTSIHDMKMFSSLVMGMTAYGYLSMSMKDLSKGKTIRVPEDPQQFMNIFGAAFAQGGAGTVYLDYLMSDPGMGSTMGRLLGPTAGTIDDVHRLMAKLLKRATDDKDDELGKYGLDILNTALRQTIGNMPVVKPVLEASFLNEWKESKSPGHTEKVRKRMRENGQDYLNPQIMGDF